MAWREIASEIAWRTRTSLSGFFASGRPALSVTNGETSRAESMCRYIRRNAGILNTETAGLAASLLMSGGGTLSMTCTSPASSAATREASAVRMRSVTRSHCGFLPQ